MMFSLFACVTYTLAYYFDWSLFQYALAENRFYFFVQDSGSGPPILWYGWLATAVLGGAAGAVIVPPRLSAKLPGDLVWLLPLAVIVAALIYEKRWFV
ncbi:MAG TPA: hypothetical protein VEU06_11435 [Micropepsaceae bacterium]|nr:hypothetical protein [Micropepsaceae bacterium]